MLVAGVGALSGSAVAITGDDATVDDEPLIRADDPGSFMTITFTADQTADDYNITLSELQDAGIENFDGATINVDNGNSLGFDAATGNLTVDASTAAEVTVLIGGPDATTPAVDADPTNTLNASGAVAGDYSVTVARDDGSDSSTDGSVTIEEDTIDSSALSAGSPINLGATTTLDAGAASLQYTSDNVGVEEGSAEFTVNRPEFGNETAATDDDGSFTVEYEGTILGTHTVYLNEEDITDGVVTGDDVSSQTTFVVDNVRLELNTPEEAVEQPAVLYNSQQTVEGTVFLTSLNASSQIVADDRVIDYTFTDPNSDVVASGDTNNGVFSVGETWDVTSENGGYERLDGLAYTVDVEDQSSNTADEDFFTVLDINWQIDGVDAADADVTYQDTVQLSGTVEDGSGNAIDGYRVGTAIYGPVGTAAKTGTTTTGNNGQFSFTFRYDEGVQDPVASTVTGADGDGLGVHLGTQQVDQPNFDFGAGVAHPVTRYLTVDTQSQDAQIDINSVQTNPVNFEDDFEIQVTDEDGNVLSDQRVLVEGGFDVSGTNSLTVTDGTEPPATTSDSRATDDGGDTVVAFHAETDVDGWLNFTATPTETSFTATVTAEDDDIDNTGQTETITLNGDDTDGSATIFTQPDAEGDETFTLGVSDPINIINFDVEDPQTENFDRDNPSAATGDSNEASIFSDDGPERIDVLPLADTSTDRFAGDLRLGLDTNRDFEGMTIYRSSFELKDEANQDIRADDVDAITVVGAGINESVDPQNGAVVNGDLVDVEESAAGEYDVLLRPVAVQSLDDGDLEISVTVDDDSASESVDASGLHAEEFLVDGEVVESVQTGTIDVATVLRNELTDDVINNARVRVTQSQQDSAQDTVELVDIDNIDARTDNVNDGEYEFTNIDLGPRGLNTAGADGIGNELAPLTFTGYQYTDADDDDALSQDEVNNATVETLDLEPSDDLVIDYTGATTPTGETVYAGDVDGDFTLTRGVEYDTLNFTLTDDDGPVDLTDGLYGEDVDLNDLTDPAQTDQDGALVQITATVDGQEVVLNNNELSFDIVRSNASAGHYVIDDIGADTAGLVESDGDTFAFNFDSQIGDNYNAGNESVINGTDRGAVDYTLAIETPDRDQVTNTDETGTFTADDPQVGVEIVGVASPELTGDDFGDLAHDETDELDENVSDVERGTIDVDRTYRFNASVSAAHDDEVALNGSDADGVFAAYTGDLFQENDLSTELFGGAAEFEMVSGVSDVDKTSTALDTALSGTYDNIASDNEVEILNADGQFTFDVQATSPQNADRLESIGQEQFTQLFAFHKGAADAAGVSHTSVAPVHERPSVQVYDQFGAELPRSESTGNQLLAIQPVQNNLLVEVYPSDPNDFVLPDGISVELVGSTAENQVAGSTTFSDSAVTAGFDETQSAQLSITPTGTGDAAVDTEVQGAQAFTRLDTGADLTELTFDVRDTNREFELSVEPDAITAGDDVTLTVLDAETDEPVSDVGDIEITDAAGDVVVDNAASGLTDENGQVTITVPETAADGTAEIRVRSAGFDPKTIDFEIGGLAPNFDVSDLDPQDVTVEQGESINVSATIENIGNADGTQTVEFRVDDDVLASEEVTLDVDDSTSVEFTNIDTSGLDEGDYTHGVYTDDSSQTATLTITVDGDDGDDEDQHESGVSQELFDAVDTDGSGDLTLGELRNAVSDWNDDGLVGGVDASLGDLRNLVSWWNTN